MTRLALLALFTLSLAGCGASFSIHAPGDYYVLESEGNGDYDYRATSADGIRLGVRELENEGHGSREFWEQAIRNQLHFHGGYAIAEEVAVRAHSGQEGKLFRCGKDEASQTYDYWVAVFVTEDSVFLVEAGGRRAQFEADTTDLRTAIESFEIR